MTGEIPRRLPCAALGEPYYWGLWADEDNGCVTAWLAKDGSDKAVEAGGYRTLTDDQEEAVLRGQWPSVLMSSSPAHPYGAGELDYAPNRFLATEFTVMEREGLLAPAGGCAEREGVSEAYTRHLLARAEFESVSRLGRAGLFPAEGLTPGSSELMYYTLPDSSALDAIACAVEEAQAARCAMEDERTVARIARALIAQQPSAAGRERVGTGNRGQNPVARALALAQVETGLAEPAAVRGAARALGLDAAAPVRSESARPGAGGQPGPERTMAEGHSGNAAPPPGGEVTDDPGQGETENTGGMLLDVGSLWAEDWRAQCAFAPQAQRPEPRAQAQGRDDWGER